MLLRRELSPVARPFRVGEATEKMILEFGHKVLVRESATSLDAGHGTYLNRGVIHVLVKEMLDIHVKIARVGDVMVLFGSGIWKGLSFRKVDIGFALLLLLTLSFLQWWLLRIWCRW